jgi:N-acetylmuramoyl-L-alanine amidase
LGATAILVTFAFLYFRDMKKAKENTTNAISHLVVQDTKIQAAGMNKNEKEEPEENKEEKPRCVVLDAGHGGIDGGTYHNDTLEKDINLAVTLYLADILAKQELEIILTRSEDEYLTLEDRAYIANRSDADFFVSIHCNYYEGKETVSGIECYYYPESKEGKLCAEIVNGVLKEEHSFKVRSPKENDFFVLENTDMTAILVEVGYISDKTEREKLTRKEYQMLLAEKLAEGIQASLKELKSQKE